MSAARSAFPHPALAGALILALLLPGCGHKRLDVPPPPPKAPVASAPSPADTTRVPPTQRPYQVFGRTYYPIPSAYGYTESGVASWYGEDFHGKKTSNGETYDMFGPTAAHKTLPMGTKLLVTNLESGEETVVRVNDRGPFVKERVIDLSLKAAREIGMADKGTARVRITALGEAERQTRDGRTEAHFLAMQNFRAGDFFVQVGSFTNKENADRLKDRLVSQGRAAVVQAYDRGDSLFHRVWVEAGHDLDAAQAMARGLETEFPGAFAVAR